MATTLSLTARKELLQPIDSLASRAGISRDKALVAWYAATILGVDEDEAIDAASVDGPEDAGCDLIYVDDESETIYVLQGYVSEKAEKSAGLKKWNALTGAVPNLQDPKAFRNAGRNDIADRLEEVDTSEYSKVFGLISLAAKSDTIDRAADTAQKTKAYGANSLFFYEHQETLYDKYLVAKSSERNVPLDTVNFTNGVAEIKGNFGTAVVGTVAAGELARLHLSHGNRLFEGNVRLFIGQRKGGINEKIVETARERAGDFWALNNGITIVAESFEAVTEEKISS